MTIQPWARANQPAISTTTTPIDRMLSADGWNLVVAGMGERTREAYMYWWGQFSTWCHATGRQPEPATVPTVISYLGYMEHQTDRTGRPTSPGTIGIILAAIRHVHRFRRDREPDFPIPDSLALTRAYVGYCNRWVAAGHRVRQTEATTWEHLTAFMSELEPDRIRDQRNRVIILCGFFAAMRSSELAGLRIEDTTVNQYGLSLYIARSKTDRTGKGSHITMRRYAIPDLCPVNAVQTWLRTLSDNGFHTGHLIRSMRARDHIRPDATGMHRLSISHVTTRLAKRLGFAGSWGAHSHRRGAATEAARAGVDLQGIMQLGRWKTPQAAMRYIEQAQYANPLTDLGPAANLDTNET